jgi:hypothetical protein
MNSTSDKSKNLPRTGITTGPVHGTFDGWHGQNVDLADEANDGRRIRPLDPELLVHYQ